ncbi:hypothetical protein GCK32_003982, partial [Trichostrongylus colubriformis]
MGPLPWRFAFMVTITVLVKNNRTQENDRHEAVKESDSQELSTLYEACQSSLRSQEEPTGMRICAWTRRQQMAEGNCPEYNFVTGYIQEHIRGCVIGVDMVICSCKDQECFKDVDDKALR